MKLKRGFRQLVDEAKSRIRSLTVEEARGRHGRDDVMFVDLRDIRELEREGMIPGAFHCPRGMLEFWIDPESPYYKDVFGSGKEFVFYCSAAWRSALAADTAQQMGLPRVTELEGGFTAWKAAGMPVAERKASKPAGLTPARRAPSAVPRRDASRYSGLRQTIRAALSSQAASVT